MEAFYSAGIREIRRRDETQYLRWNNIVSRIDGLPRDSRVIQATELVQRALESVARRAGEQIAEHLFALNAAKRFYMSLSLEQIESGSPYHGRTATRVARETAIVEAFGTVMAVLSELDALPLIFILKTENQKWQHTAAAYIEILQSEINRQHADIRYVVKCMNAMEKACHEELRTRLRSMGRS